MGSWLGDREGLKVGVEDWWVSVWAGGCSGGWVGGGREGGGGEGSIAREPGMCGVRGAMGWMCVGRRDGECGGA